MYSVVMGGPGAVPNKMSQAPAKQSINATPNTPAFAGGNDKPTAKARSKEPFTMCLAICGIGCAAVVGLGILAGVLAYKGISKILSPISWLTSKLGGGAAA